MPMKYIILSLAIVSFTPAFGEQHVTGFDKWKNFAEENKWGGSRDFWLEKDTAWGWEKVALILGYYDDYAGCLDIKETLEAKYGGPYYRCMPANKP